MVIDFCVFSLTRVSFFSSIMVLLLKQVQRKLNPDYILYHRTQKRKINRGDDEFFSSRTRRKRDDAIVHLFIHLLNPSPYAITSPNIPQFSLHLRNEQNILLFLHEFNMKILYSYNKNYIMV